MTAQIILADFKGKTWTRDKNVKGNFCVPNETTLAALEELNRGKGFTDFAALEAEIAVALWCGPEQGIYMADDKDSA